MKTVYKMPMSRHELHTSSPKSFVKSSVATPHAKNELARFVRY